MRVLITGDRHGYGIDEMEIAIKRIEPDFIVIGDEYGVDSNAKLICEKRKINHSIYYAEWDKYGLNAGPIRNRLMLNQDIDLVLAFHKDILHSKGTKNCIDQAKQMGIKVELYE